MSGFYITLTPFVSGIRPVPGHRVRNGLDVALNIRKGEARHAYFWGACEPGDLSAAAPVDHGPECGLTDYFGYWG